MSITDELRTWMYGHTVNCSGNRIALAAIADRIDAEHEKAAAGCIHYDPERHYCAVHGDTENGWVRLPKDADGVPIHIGDMLTDSAEYKSEGVVKRLMVEPTGWSVNFDAGWSDERFHDWHHYTPPTVENVLREFAEKVIDSQIPDVHPTYEEAIAEYAAKLRLAGDGE